MNSAAIANRRRRGVRRSRCRQPSGILAGMLRGSSFALLLWMLAIALVPLRMANAHLHFCLDGQQAPVSLHVQDRPGHDHAAEQLAGHTDVDVDFPVANTIAKLPSGGDDLPVFLPLYVLAILLPAQRHEAPRPTVTVVDVGAVAKLRPPVRGPPAQVSFR